MLRVGTGLGAQPGVCNQGTDKGKDIARSLDAAREFREGWRSRRGDTAQGKSTWPRVCGGAWPGPFAAPLEAWSQRLGAVARGGLLSSTFSTGSTLASVSAGAKERWDGRWQSWRGTRVAQHSQFPAPAMATAVPPAALDPDTPHFTLHLSPPC